MRNFFLALREEVGLESILGAAPPKPGSLAVVNRLVELVILMERFRAEQPEPAAADRASAAPDMSEILRYLYCHTGEKADAQGALAHLLCLREQPEQLYQRHDGTLVL